MRRLLVVIVLLAGCGSKGSYPRLVVAEDIWDAEWIAVINDNPRERTKLDTVEFRDQSPGTVVVFDRDPSDDHAVALETIPSPTERLEIFTRYDDLLCLSDWSVLCSILTIEWGDHDELGHLLGWEVFEMRLSDPPTPIGSPDLNGYQWWAIEMPATLLDLIFEGDALRAGIEVNIDNWYGREGARFVLVTGEYARRE